VNIAVATDGDTLYGEVSEEFNLCKFLLITSMDDMKFTAIENEARN
jgi:predicted Fe-Mo cluster-binding NifX family protein